MLRVRSDLSAALPTCGRAVRLLPRTSLAPPTVRVASCSATRNGALLPRPQPTVRLAATVRRCRRPSVLLCKTTALAAAVGAADSAADSDAASPAGMLKYYAAFLVFGCAVNTIGPMLPSLAAHVGLAPVQMAPLLTAKGLGGLAGSFLCPLLPLVRRAAAQLRTQHADSLLTSSRGCSCLAGC